MLTIAIPTYNRLAALRTALVDLSAQICAGCRVIVVDNHSSPPVSSALTAREMEGVRVIVNEVNVGLAGNIRRCFEVCETDWLWILGDDDRIESSAVQSVLSQIKADPSSSFIHFGSPLGLHTSDFAMRSVPECVARVSISALLFISTGVYNARKLKPFYGVLHTAAHTTGPHMALVLVALDAGHYIRASRSVIVKFRQTAEPRWSTLDFIEAITWMPRITLSSSSRSEIAYSILKHHYYWALFCGLREINNPGGVDKWRYARKIARLRLRYHGALDMLISKLERRTILRVVVYEVLLILIAHSPAWLLQKSWYTRCLHPARGQANQEERTPCD